MKCAVLCLILSSNLLASPLLFKITKTNPSDTSIQLASFDATKYKQLRIGIVVERENDLNCTLGRPGKERIALNLQYPCSYVSYGMSVDDEFFPFESDKYDPRRLFIIDTPAHKIDFTANGKGTFKLFIWGQ